MYLFQVVLDGIHNILKMAGEEAEPVANIIEECGGNLLYAEKAYVVFMAWNIMHSCTKTLLEVVAKVTSFTLRYVRFGI